MLCAFVCIVCVEGVVSVCGRSCMCWCVMCVDLYGVCVGVNASLFYMLCMVYVFLMCFVFCVCCMCVVCGFLFCFVCVVLHMCVFVCVVFVVYCWWRV